MLQLQDHRRPPITPQLALRVAVLAGVALAMFGIVFFRLWYLQVLSGDKYLAEANDNRVRDIVVPAPRGDVTDRNSTVLVDNRISIAVQIEPQKLPPPGARRAALYDRLGRVIRRSPARIAREVAEQRKVLPYSTITVKQDVSPTVRDYVLERQNEFPSVVVQKIYLRHYPHKELGAQLFGTVGQISPKELKMPRFRGVDQGTVVGQGGLEWTYDRWLRGVPGATRVQVDALGRPKGELAIHEPTQGKQLKLSVDLDLERAGQNAMSEAAGIPITNGEQNRGGAFVALDPRNGQVLAMGSYPSFDPNLFAKPIKESTFKKLNSVETGAPLVDRVIDGLYPTGSTMKPITSVAALQSGVITPDTPIDDPGSVQIGNIVFHNSGGTAHGTVSLPTALQVSSDVFFYIMGSRLDSVPGQPLQKWARRLGLGRPTGVDLPGETKGLVPSPGWRNRLYRRKLTDRPWSVGDNVNFAVGQGDLQATPLQMAVAYSAIANGGRVITPHIGLRIEDAAGRLLQEVDPPPSRRVKINEYNRQAILNGLELAAGTPPGTSADVFAGFPYRVMGKTGTAERPGWGDQSWYVCYAPAAGGKGPIVVAVTVEQGGWGASAAAPAARLILSQWFNVQKKLVVGSSHTR
ncbi:MAG: penicillin-binding protein 2 [Solirubrobacteraceae bacterium]